MKAVFLLSYFDNKDIYKSKGFLSKAKKVLIDETFAKFQYKHVLLTDKTTNKFKESVYVFPADSNKQH